MLGREVPLAAGEASIEILVDSGLLGKTIVRANRSVGVIYSAANDDLKLIAGPLATHDSGQPLDVAGPHEALVLDSEPKSGHAMREVRNVGFSTKKSHDLLGELLIFL